MTTFARFVCLFTLACWVGGILFFGGVEARALFHHLPRRDAGVVVAASLHSLHRGGILAGAVLLLCLLLFPAMLRARVRVTAIALAAVMLAATAGLNYMITYKMEPLRASAPGEDISALPDNDAVRQSFDAMHAWSTRLESSVLLAGVGLLFCFATPFGGLRRQAVTQHKPVSRHRTG